MKRISFDLELANIYETYEPGKHIVTRDGRPVSIVCTNLSGKFPFVGKYTAANGDEIIIQTSKNGFCSLVPNSQDDDDLFLLVEEPKFNIGDTIRPKEGGMPITIQDIDDLYYRFENNYTISIKTQDDWEIVHSSEKELTEFEKELKVIINGFDNKKITNIGAKKSGTRLLDIARKEFKKDIPKCKKCILACGIEEKVDFIIKGPNNTYYLSNIIKYGDLFLRLSELEKLPKED